MKPVAASVIGTVAVFGSLAFLGSVVLNQVASSEAERGAGTRGAIAAHVALAPYLVDDILIGERAAMELLNTASLGVINEAEAVHIKIWAEDGRIIWSDDRRLIGQTFEFDPEEQALFSSQGTTTAIGKLEKAENVFDGESGDRLLEVYLGTSTSPSRTPVLVEAYFPYDSVDERAAELRRSFLPLLIGGLALLAAAQVPLTISLARRLEHNRKERERLYERVMEASTVERKRIAGQVHDGALQDLIGVSYQIAGMAERTSGGLRVELTTLGVTTRRTIRSLRSVLSSIYPVEVPLCGWVHGLDDLTDTFGERGVETMIDVPDLQLSPTEEQLLLRVSREALRNVLSHADCRSVAVRLTLVDDVLRLTIDDDGRGYDSTTARRQKQAGHLGQRLLEDLARDVGASLSIDSSPGDGTHFELVIPERV